MNFSDAFKQSGNLCRFSPNGEYIACGAQYRLVVRDVKTLQIKALFTCLDAINFIQWSSDSNLILCAMYKRGITQVWNLDDTDWKCKIDEGSAGLMAVRFAPDGRHILSTSEFKLRITVWSLINKTVSYIKYPKHASQGLSFTDNGKYMALAERRNCKDFISIFACDSWEMLKHFESDTIDLADISWSPNGRMLAAWDSNLEYKIVIYSVDGRFLSSYSAYDNALGIKSVTWSPSSQFVAIGSYDQTVRVLNNLTWKPVAEHAHPTALNSSTAVIYREQEKKPVTLPWERETLAPLQCPSLYEVASPPLQVPVTKPDPEKANPKLGVGTVLYSADNRYMATKNDNMPCVAWIWNVVKLKLAAVLVQCHSIKAMAWDPVQTRLALCTGTNKLYMWSPAGCLSVDVPSEGAFLVTGLQWHKSGTGLALLSKDEMCLCFLGEHEG